MLEIGDKVPDFTLPVANKDGSTGMLAWRDVVDKGPVVFEFFPAAMTRVCTAQMCDARDNRALFDRLGATVFGFSTDKVEKNATFVKTDSLGHAILSDPAADTLEKIWGTEKVLGVYKISLRGWMVVDAEGRVAAKWVAEQRGAPWPGIAPIQAALEAVAKSSA
ncbi:MAG: peroxiredoxin [Thermoplasmatota archaeon]